MFKKLISECRSLVEAVPNDNLMRSPSHQLRAAQNVFGGDDKKMPEILTRALRKKAASTSGMSGIQRGATLIRKKATPPPPPPEAMRRKGTPPPPPPQAFRKPGDPSPETKAALADLPHRKKMGESKGFAKKGAKKPLPSRS